MTTPIDQSTLIADHEKAYALLFAEAGKQKELIRELVGALQNVWHTAQAIGTDDAKAFFDIAHSAISRVPAEFKE